MLDDARRGGPPRRPGRRLRMPRRQRHRHRHRRRDRRRTSSSRSSRRRRSARAPASAWRRCTGSSRQSGGHIVVHSELGLGTSFKVYLPAAAREADIRAYRPDERPAELAGTETVLVVEDDDAVRAFIDAVLLENGYRSLVDRAGRRGARARQDAPRSDRPRAHRRRHAARCPARSWPAARRGAAGIEADLPLRVRRRDRARPGASRAEASSSRNRSRTSRCCKRFALSWRPPGLHDADELARNTSARVSSRSGWAQQNSLHNIPLRFAAASAILSAETVHFRC